jgi:pimeloyl-ACP methyl ester carboxylesterase
MKGNARADDYHQLFDNAQWMARVMTYTEPPPREMLQKQLNIVMMSPLVRRAIGAGLALDNRDLAPALTLPTLLIHGEKDTSVPGYKIAEMLSVLPDASALPVANAGHSPFAEAPQLFNDALLNFVTTHRGEDP